MAESSEQYKILEKRIVDAQKNLKDKNPNHPLLKLVNVDEIGIHWTAEFGERYEGMSASKGLDKYLSELKSALNSKSSD